MQNHFLVLVHCMPVCVCVWGGGSCVCACVCAGGFQGVEFPSAKKQCSLINTWSPPEISILKWRHNDSMITMVQ